ncbi:hypothetical protein LJC34_05430 [Oscillospiraceae bacterium OttesenSCG-928-G22]|nr:hypothetical protein [Oscillospiraceae bacterium OttesenSCG-928-G22]
MFIYAACYIALIFYIDYFTDFAYYFGGFMGFILIIELIPMLLIGKLMSPVRVYGYDPKEWTSPLAETQIQWLSYGEGGLRFPKIALQSGIILQANFFNEQGQKIVSLFD